VSKSKVEMEHKNLINRLINQNLDKDVISDFKISFFSFLDKNKIDFQIVDNLKDSYLILKTLTIEPSFFMIILNKNDIKNALINYENLKYFQGKMNKEKNIKKRFYILLLNPSINNADDVLTKSQYVNFDKISTKDEFRRIKDVNIKISITMKKTR